MANGEGEEESVWQKILVGTRREEESSDLPRRTIVVLGDRTCGKSTLLSRVFASKAAKKSNANEEHDIALASGTGLDYSYQEVVGEYAEDVLGAVDVWTLDADHPKYESLVQFALKPNDLSRTAVVLCLDMAKPWDLISSLDRWIGVLKVQLKANAAMEKAAATGKKNVVFRFQSYQEAPKEVETEGKGGRRKRVRKIVTSRVAGEDTELLPLPEGVLGDNLGVSVIVVCCKTDAMDTLSREYDYKQDQFEYIQVALRKRCLQYGASLVYTSGSRQLNTACLRDVLEHELFGFNLPHRAQVLEKDTVFIPCGWDSTSAVDADFASQKFCTDSTVPFGEVVTAPPSSSVSSSSPSTPAHDDVQSEPESAFLDRCLRIAERADAARGEARDSPSSASSSSVSSPSTPAGGSSGLMSSLRKIAAISPASSTASTPSTPSTPSQFTRTSGKTSATSTPLGAAAAAAAARKTPGTPNPSEHTVIANFFNSLIKKGPRKTSSASSSPSPASPAATPGDSIDEIGRASCRERV
eukprot:TRINITY_DN629_c0_g1_i4.p1 TRINITY_DN629_c0_g1~~TRINITY_DN629_c0_g1_i4.p1  ORF type:complete len:526 (-),score=120.07 TRINITY_DN629_c0_g1_i4:88-1665(-)